MNFTQFFLILRARYRIILATLIVTVAATVLVSLLLPKIYKATTSVILNYKGVDSVTGLTLPSQLIPSYMATQIDILGSRNVALRVVDELKLADDPESQRQYAALAEPKVPLRDWLAINLLTGLEVEPARASSVLEISYKARDPQFAARAANAFAQAYQQISLQLKIEPSQKASSYFTTQIKALRDQLEQAQNRLSTYQQKHGITDADNKGDVESARLSELSSQLVQAQAQVIEAASRQRQAQSSAGVSADVMSNATVQSLKVSLANAEAKFAEISEKFGKNHPQYLAAKSEMDKVRSNLAEQTRVAASGIAGNTRILQQREAEIRAALAAQRAKVMTLNGSRDELMVLTNEMESAKRAYDGASLRFSQTNLEGQSNQSDISVLSPALPSLNASSPRTSLNVLASVLLGLMLGLGLATIVELFNRRVRSSDDLALAFNAPVLGVVNWSQPARKTRFGNRSLKHNLKSN
ncbi:MAG: chain length determinant protein EpsF [Janthinobacterium lividum]